MTPTAADTSTVQFLARHAVLQRPLLELLARDAAVHREEETGFTALMHAIVERRPTSLLRVLVDAGAPVSVRDAAGRTALYHAAACGNAAAVDLLLRAGTDCNSAADDGCTALHVACRRGRVECARLLCAAGASTKAIYAAQTPLLAACTIRQVQCIDVLISAKADVNAVVGDQAPVHVACFHGDLDVLRLLLDANADPDITARDGCTALYAATMNGRVDCARLLCEAGASLDVLCGDRTPLIVACTLKRTECARVLVAANANVNVCCKDETPLHEACFHGDLAVVRTLLDAGARTDVRTTFTRRLAFDVALYRGHVRCADAVRATFAHCDLTTLLHRSLSSLLLAIELGNAHRLEASVLALVRWGCDVTRPVVPDGTLPRQLAMERGFVPCWILEPGQARAVRRAYLERRWRQHVHLRACVNFWLSLTEPLYAPGGKGRKRDLDAFLDSCDAVAL